MKLLLEGIIARVQRDFKVILAHMTWLGNHPHMIIQARDAEACKRFYGEIQKQLTDAVKRLLGVSSLSLWKSNATSVVRLQGVDTIIKRIAYLYANPARAHLVDSIDLYPGVSSWAAFLRTPPTLDASTSRSCPWIRAPMIPKLPSRSVTDRQDQHLSKQMLAEADESHPLTFQHNVWMKEYGIVTPTEIAKVNQRIVLMTREYEEEARQVRFRNNWKTKGASRLRREPLDLSYIPAKETRRIFVYALDRETRISLILEHRAFSKACRECYRRWQRGDYAIDWPPGAYKPPQPNNINWLAS